MYTLFKSLTTRQLASTQLPSLVGGLVVAEVFYKFHSFTLECVAFLATWAVFDFVLSKLSAGREARLSCVGAPCATTAVVTRRGTAIAATFIHLQRHRHRARPLDRAAAAAGDLTAAH
jgi:hypothetical protein